MARVMRRFVGHMGETHPVQNEKTQRRRHDGSRGPLGGKRRIFSQNRYKARHITLRVVVRDCAQVPIRFHRTARGPGDGRSPGLRVVVSVPSLPGFPVAGPAQGPIWNRYSPLTVAGAAAELPTYRAHRRSLFVSQAREPSGGTVDEDARSGQSNARRKESWRRPGSIFSVERVHEIDRGYDLSRPALEGSLPDLDGWRGVRGCALGRAA